LLREVRERLKSGFLDDVDEFAWYSLSVQNRLKARAGAALEKLRWLGIVLAPVRARCPIEEILNLNVYLFIPYIRRKLGEEIARVGACRTTFMCHH
jgi:hypothetical protein